MRIINWNISFKCDIYKIIEKLQILISNIDYFVINLQEVKPTHYEILKKSFLHTANLYYSLNYRKIGKYDTDSRKLGVAIIVSNPLIVENSNVFDRTLMPDRTLFVKLKFKDQEIKIASFHSITGCAHKKAKSIQFYSFTEAIETFKPDIISIDANEPEIDHYDICQMKFFDNQDKGKGAKTFFEMCQELNLVDSFTVKYNKSLYELGQPLTTSHIVGKGKYKKNKRYDFLFINNKYQILKTNYYFNEAKTSTSDHAYIVCDIKI